MTVFEFVNSYEHCAINGLTKDDVEFLVESFEIDYHCPYNKGNLMSMASSISAFRFHDGMLSGFLGGAFYERGRKYARGATVEAVCLCCDLHKIEMPRISGIESLL